MTKTHKETNLITENQKKIEFAWDTTEIEKEVFSNGK